MSDVLPNYDLDVYGQDQERPREEVISGHGFLGTLFNYRKNQWR